MSKFAAKAKEIAAKATGLRPDQVERAVSEYRAAVVDLHNEPEWVAIMHMSGQSMGIHQYGSEHTKITKQIECEVVRGNWESVECFVYDGKPYDNYSEAREVELMATAKPKPYEI